MDRRLSFKTSLSTLRLGDDGDGYEWLSGQSCVRHIAYVEVFLVLRAKTEAFLIL